MSKIIDISDLLPAQQEEILQKVRKMKENNIVISTDTLNAQVNDYIMYSYTYSDGNKKIEEGIITKIEDDNYRVVDEYNSGGSTIISGKDILMIKIIWKKKVELLMGLGGDLTDKQLSNILLDNDLFVNKNGEIVCQYTTFINGRGKVNPGYFIVYDDKKDFFQEGTVERKLINGANSYDYYISSKEILKLLNLGEITIKKQF